MPLDPQIQAILSQSPGMAPARTFTPAQLRALVKQYSSAFPPLQVPIGAVTDLSIAGPGGLLALRVYKPQGPAPHPVVVYFHGGGWVVGDLDTQDMICRGLCHGADCLVVSVDYRLAPEHPFPAAPQDAYAAVQWVARNAAELGGNPAQLAVAGDSAGAILSGTVTLRARDEQGPALCGQVLFYGSMDYELDAPSASVHEFADGPLLSSDDIHFFWHQYLQNFDADLRNPLAVPARAADHSRLPPAFVGTAEIDPTRDAAERYADLLRDAGVEVEQHRYTGMPHGFISWLGIAAGAQQAIDDASAWLRRQFARVVR